MGQTVLNSSQVGVQINFITGAEIFTQEIDAIGQ